MMRIMMVVSGLMIAFNGLLILLVGSVLFGLFSGGEEGNSLLVLLIVVMPLANLFFSLQFNGERPRFLWAGFWLNAAALFTYLNFFFLADYSPGEYMSIRAGFKSIVIYLLIHLSYAPILLRYRQK